MKIPLAILAGVSLCLVACRGGTGPAAPPATHTPSTSASQAPSNTVWLCRPGIPDDPCTGDLTTTVIHPDGSTTIEHDSPAPNPPVDCFYVYPTVSLQQSVNATLAIEPAETGVARLQASRFSMDCSVYAPMYRQITLRGLFMSGSVGNAAAIAYGDVASAWEDYLAHYNHRRGVILIGHSQGSFMLEELIHNTIDASPSARSQLVSAILLGGDVQVAVPRGGPGAAPSSTVTQGAASPTFANIPPCTSDTQTGCVVAYSSFDNPPPTDSLFGRVGSGPPNANVGTAPDLMVACTNPARLSGGPGPLLPYFPTTINGLTGGSGQPEVSTPWVSYPDLFQGVCMDQSGASWLQINDVRSSGDSRPHTSDAQGPTWGLHIIDVNIALGNLVTVAHSQAASWLRHHAP